MLSAASIMSLPLICFHTFFSTNALFSVVGTQLNVSTVAAGIASLRSGFVSQSFNIIRVFQGNVPTLQLFVYVFLHLCVCICQYVYIYRVLQLSG